MFRRLIFDDGAQDLVEYALLGALIGIVGIAAWTNVGAAIAGTYAAWDSNTTGVPSLWVMPDPI